MTTEQRITELIALAAEEGIELPLPAELIVVYELAGHVVDLATGAVIRRGAEQRIAPGTALCDQEQQEGQP